MQSNLRRECNLHNPRAAEVFATFLVDETSAFEVTEKTMARFVFLVEKMWFHGMSLQDFAGVLCVVIGMTCLMLYAPFCQNNIDA